MLAFIIGVSTTHLIYSLISKEHFLLKFTNLAVCDCNHHVDEGQVENNVDKQDLEQILHRRKRKMDQFCEIELSENAYQWDFFLSKDHLLLQTQANFTFCM